MMKVQLTKTNQTLLFFVLITVILYYGKPILIPFSFALLLAMLMAPVCRKLDHKGLHRALSAAICVFILLLVLLGMIAILIGQVSGFVGDISALEQRTDELFNSLKNFIELRFGISAAEQTAFLKNETRNISAFLKNYLTGMLRSSLQLMTGVIITLIFTFLFLYHKEKYHAFFLKFIAGDTPEKREEILTSIGQVSQHYLIGRAISIVSLFVLYAIALLIIGVKNALLLAAVAALFNIIPYLGPILAAIIPFLIVLVTEDGNQPAIWTLACFCFFQAVDNYFITPYFLGGEVSLSALSTILIMICGGFLWGIAGMILFIPLLSIAKIFFDHIPQLQPYGFLIGGQETRPSQRFQNWLKNLFKKNHSNKGRK